MKQSSRYCDLTSDAGFKITFSDPANKPLLIGLINAIIKEREVVDIEYLDSEIRPEDIKDKRVRFDIRCREKDGASFIVEMQKDGYSHMVDRLIVYAGDPLKRMLKAGQKYEETKPLYVICIANFIFSFNGDGPQERRRLLRTAKLMMTDTREVLSDTLNFIFLQLPVVGELEDGQPFLEKLAYSIRNMKYMTEKPSQLTEPYFDMLFESADKRTMDRAKLKFYDNMIHDEVYYEAVKDFAVKNALKEGIEKGMEKGRKEGRTEGKAEGRAEGAQSANIKAARNLKIEGIDLGTIARCTGLSVDFVNSL